MDAEIRYSFDLSNVNWTELKAELKKDDFDNGRTPAQYKESYENSFAVCIAYDGDRMIGTVRVISDGNTNAYIVDVWTQSEYRLHGVARKMMDLTLERLPGQHVYLFTDEEAIGFYHKLGFKEQGIGVGKVVGKFLVNA